MTGAWLLPGVVVAVALLAAAAYHCGRRRPLGLLPPALVAELAAHKLACLGESPARVRRELTLVSGEHPTAHDRVSRAS